MERHQRAYSWHGHAKPQTRTYRSWKTMWSRCTNPNFDSFKYYGGRGITVCRRWQMFSNFLADMGVRPPDRTLDRIKIDGNYCKSNCRWADKITQSRNRHQRGYLMHKADVKIGSFYTAKVSGKIAIIQLQSESQYGGWNAVNVGTNRDVRIRSAARLRHQVERNDKGGWSAGKDSACVS